MAKISSSFKLGKSQRELDFIDIDPNKDLGVYINPFTLSTRVDPFSVGSTRIIRGFFQHNIELVRAGKESLARENFRHLNEPNETCLGMSKKKPSGKGMGSINTDDLFESIKNSEAVRSGLLEDIEDTAIFIPTIGKDKVSDMTTNIMRSLLIRYTQDQCKLLDIPLTKDVPSGFFWDQTRFLWREELTEMLVIKGKKILLVPKGIASYVKEFNASKYHRAHALVFLQGDHIRRKTPLVQRTYNKNGSVNRIFVTKKSLIENELPENKLLLTDFTLKHPEIFKAFRDTAVAKIKPIANSELEDIDEKELIDYLVRQLRSIKPGAAGAHKYHSLMKGILEFIFYPNLINPCKEKEINEGRKRIDLTFDNGAPRSGFFYRLQHSMGIPCPYILVECKNYSDDLENPELDQMVGRFAPNRGKFGIIVCRTIAKKELFMSRCTDSYKAQHGLIVPITDDDIINILSKIKEGISHPEEEILSDLARKIALQ